MADELASRDDNRTPVALGISSSGEIRQLRVDDNGRMHTAGVSGPLILAAAERLLLTGLAQEVTHSAATCRVVITNEIANTGCIYVSGSSASAASGDEIPQGASWAADIDINATPIYILGTASDYARISRFTV